MTDIFEKTLYLGLGIVSMTKDRAEEIINDLVERGKVSENESAKAVRDLMSRAEKERNALDTKINEAIEKAVKGMHLATRQDIEEINRKLDELMEKPKTSAKSKRTEKET
jgi:polyhydroxyalkanoate synthesis regulator phasin